jgi:hypothetical protein
MLGYTIIGHNKNIIQSDDTYSWIFCTRISVSNVI